MAAFGGAIWAGALILTALNHMRNIDEDAPWITLFDRRSRRFEVTAQGAVRLKRGRASS